MKKLGATLRRAGLRRVAAGPLGQGLELARGCGARAEAARAEAELAAGRPRRRSVLLSGVASLTPSERRVCALAAQGLSNAAIAGALVVTRKTVETHLGHAYSKLGIRGRNELIAALGDAIASPEGRTS